MYFMYWIKIKNVTHGSKQICCIPFCVIQYEYNYYTKYFKLMGVSHNKSWKNSQIFKTSFVVLIKTNIILGNNMVLT